MSAGGVYSAQAPRAAADRRVRTPVPRARAHAFARRAVADRLGRGAARRSPAPAARHARAHAAAGRRPALPPADATPRPPRPHRPSLDAARVYDEEEVDVKPRRIAGTTGAYPEWGPKLPKGKSVSITASYVVTEEGLVTDIRVERAGGVSRPFCRRSAGGSTSRPEGRRAGEGAGPHEAHVHRRLRRSSIVSLAATTVDPLRISTLTVRRPSTSAQAPRQRAREGPPGGERLAVVPDADLGPAAVDEEADEEAVGARGLAVDHDGVDPPPAAEVLYPAACPSSDGPAWYPTPVSQWLPFRMLARCPGLPIQPATTSFGEE